jgi:hypothetical protein
MKKNKIIQGILLIAIVINYGCETDANVIVPAGERKLVVGGFLSPSENEHQISLSQTDPLFSTDPPISLANVKLTISSDSSSYSPSYDFNSVKIGICAYSAVLFERDNFGFETLVWREKNF